MRISCISLLVLLTAALLAAAPTTLATRDAAVRPAVEDAANEPAAPFIALVKMLLGGGAGGDAAAAYNDASTVAELAQNAPGNMSLLVDGVERAGLHTAIADPNFQATIFAPTNRAFEIALIKFKITPAQLWTDKTALTNLLSYHTIQGKALAAADLHDGQKLTTVSQHELTVKVDKVAGTTIEGAEDSAKVVAADICAGKAIIHVIDTVLVPPKPTS